MGEAARTLEEASNRCRLTQKQANDVRWFWTDAEAELGMKAGDIETMGRVQAVVPNDTRRAQAYQRYTRINSIFDAMPTGQYRVLQRFYGITLWRGLEGFGGLGGLALRSQAARRGFRDETHRAQASPAAFEEWLKALSYRYRLAGKSLSPEDARLARAIIRESDDMLGRSVRSYQREELLYDVRARRSRLARIRAYRPWTGAPGDEE